MSSEEEEDIYEEEDDYEWLLDETVGRPTPVAEPTIPTPSGSNAATQRLIKDLRAMGSLVGISAAPMGDNLYEWEVRFSEFEGPLARDLALLGESSVELRMSFSSDYPFVPPFVRVVKPRFQFHTGHVTIGGSICMELLTRSGWRPINDLESILVQVRSEMLAGGARLDLVNRGEYSESEAKQAFERVAAQHGWN